MSENFYPRPPRGGRLPRDRVCPCNHGISIHALREEGDWVQHFLHGGERNFYPRPPRGGRPHSTHTLVFVHKFLSTPSARRATALDHALAGAIQFLSTPSARRATSGCCRTAAAKQISIHALREEGDFRLDGVHDNLIDFYPRPPRGGRPDCPRLDNTRHKFLSTPSARRATAYTVAAFPAVFISIHALREEGDQFFQIHSHPPHYFYPRPPRGGRQQKQRQNLYFQTNYTTFCTNLEEP